MNIKEILAQKKAKARTESSMLEALAALAILTRMDFCDYKDMAEWLECYQYILPENRKIAPYIRSFIIQSIVFHPEASKRCLIEAHLLCDLIETTLKPEQQLNVLNILEGG